VYLFTRKFNCIKLLWSHMLECLLQGER